MIIKTLALAILVEALVQLIFTAAPLQDPRRWIIKKTPWIRSTEHGHLLECKYCVSVWIGAGVVLLATFADCGVTRFVAFSLIIARIGNYLHVICNTIRDAQLNMRLARK